MSSKYPPIVMSLTHGFDGWLVGSAADPSNTTPRDYDIMIPFENWHKACVVVPSDSKPNSFGGWKFTREGVEIDIWPGDLSWLAQRPKFKFALHPLTNTLIQKV